MICPNCGKEAGASKFCSECGGRIVPPTSQPIQRTQPVQSGAFEIKNPGITYTDNNNIDIKVNNSTLLKLAFVSLIGGILATIAYFLISFNVVIFIACVFFFFFLFFIAAFAIKKLYTHVSRPLNILAILASFLFAAVIGVALYFFESQINEYGIYTYLLYGMYTLIGLGFTSTFILICRVVFKKN